MRIGRRGGAWRAGARVSLRPAASASFASCFLALLVAALAPSVARAGTVVAASSRVAVSDTTQHSPATAHHRAPRKKKRHGKKGPPPKRAKVGERVPVEITYYCLQGTTRTDNPTRDGIVAADARVFPLRRHVELFARGRSLGRFLVDDTGDLVRGHVIDVWVPSCADARHRGRHRGYAVLLKKGSVVDEGLAAR